MGCLNSNQGFTHWFGNCHLSGACNRSCYFCIGQHMMALDSYNNLDLWPLKNIDSFVEKCLQHNVKEVNLTGTNTDPLMYRHTDKLLAYLEGAIPDLVFGVRTNGVLVSRYLDRWAFFDKASISLPTFDPERYARIMGPGGVPDLARLLRESAGKPIKVNVVLCPETVSPNRKDLFDTLDRLADLGIERVNLREPYGQPHIGDPLANLHVDATSGEGVRTCKRIGTRLGMPYYAWRGMDVTYWDVHYVEVESVNLYASGEVSVLYPITKGHDPKTGEVKDQAQFPGGRVREQWVGLKVME